MKVLKKIFVAGTLLALIAVLAATAYFFVVTADAKLDSGKLTQAGNYAEVLDADGEKVAEVSFLGADKKVKLEDIPDSAKYAFIAAEDKKFYRHSGLDYARMLKATVKNIGARSFKQGASTISQQLIKNTHLTNEKTLERKLKEIRLTKQLEKKFTKDEILEAYLNTIYFGHNCYGIAGAADYYFGKSVQELTPAESATLAAVIRSPSRYSPFLHPEKCLPARNGVLKKMYEQGYLPQAEYEQALQAPLPQKQENTISSRSYLQCVSEELQDIALLYSPYRFLHGIRIYTYLDAALQNYLENLKTDADRSGKSIVVEDNKTYGITAWYTSEGNIARQPGSLIKPLAVYAPGIEEYLISPCTPIADEPTDFDGYTPSNYKDIYHGFVSVRQALSESLNVPAVKILARLGTDKSETYLGKMGLRIAAGDKNLSLALGGLSEGFSLQELAGAYTLFSNRGIYAPPAFIRRIEDADGKILYERTIEKRKVFSEDTVYLINEILKDAAQTGTAKKLATLPFPVCAKTGTCGNESGNTDAYAVSYTGSHTVGVWMGNADNTRISITGGGLPCHYAMLINKYLYKAEKPEPLPTCETIEEVPIDSIAYEKYHEVLLAPPEEPSRYTILASFRMGAAPTQYATSFLPPQVEAEVRYFNGSIFIDICQAEYFNIEIKRSNSGKEKIIYDGKARSYKDSDIKKGEKYLYTVTPYYISDAGEKIYGKALTLPSVYLRKGDTGQFEDNGPFGRWWENCMSNL